MAEAEKPEKPKRRIRTSISRNVMKVSFVRNWYIKRTLKFIDKSKEKGRRLPPELADMNRALSKVPKAQRAKVLAEAMEAGQEGLQDTSRAYRRAAENQNRQSGRGRGRTRPGLPPGAMQQGRRKSP
jgi:predicted DNA-binding protein